MELSVDVTVELARVPISSSKWGPNTIRRRSPSVPSVALCTIEFGPFRLPGTSYLIAQKPTTGQL